MARESPVLAGEFFIGETKTLRIRVDQGDNDDPDLATPEDISGEDLEWVLRLGANGTSPLITKTTGGGGITIPIGTDGIALVVIDAANSLALTEGPSEEYFHTLRRSTPGSELVYNFGQFVFDQPATR